MKIWCDSVKAAAKGKTAGTFDDIGTVTLKKGAQAVLGFIVLTVPAAVTDGENGALQLKVDSKDLGISQQKFLLSTVLTDGIATNDKEAPVFAEFLPFKIYSGKSLDNAKIDFSVSGTVTTTGGWSVAVGVVFADSEPDDDLIREFSTAMPPRASGGDVKAANAGISATTFTAFSNGLEITSEAEEIIGLLGLVNPNAPTAGEEVCGIVEFQASQINDFSPQKWPFIVGWTPPLGTPVGTPVPVSRWPGLIIPTRFPLPKTNFTMTVQMALAAALTNAGDGIAAIRWR